MPELFLKTRGWIWMLPKIIDLFSGCGGLTLGFKKVGFEIAAGIELMPAACQTISYNLDFRYGREQSYICADITKIDAADFKDKFGKEGCIVIGGPPCQAYSIAGRSKLRSLGKDRINTKDSRGYLYQDFLRFVFELDAKAVVMENVPESTNFGEMNIPEIVCKSLEEHGYKAFWTVLNAADYGVPQVRERVFVLGIKEELGKMIELPYPTHKSRGNYQTTNQKRFESFLQNRYFRKPNTSTDAKKEWITVGEALSDLPVLFPSIKDKYRLVKLNEEKDYRTDPQNEFQYSMRYWYGDESIGVTANAFRNNKRDFPIFARMRQGDDYTAASRIADELFTQEAVVFGFKPGTAEYTRLQHKIVPVYDRDNFLTKWYRLEENRPSHTIIAHLSKDTYGYIHPTEPRGISVREAARIQSFPDDFYFNCSMGDAFKQIGNAVPPLLALAVAQIICYAFKED